MESYHNPVNETLEQQIQSEQKAVNQEELVLDFFKKLPGHNFTPFQVQSVALPKVPITSVRRAITNLTKQGHLEKTSIYQEGNYGKQNHTWKLKGIFTQAQLF